MKREMPPAAIAGVLGLIALVLAIGVWRVFAPPPTPKFTASAAGFPGVTPAPYRPGGKLPIGVAPPGGAPAALATSAAAGKVNTGR